MMRILIADDHAVVRSGAPDDPGTDRSDWEVVAEAEDGRQAVELADETNPDVAILDYQLPRMNGVDATRELRSRHPNTEVLIFTMHESEPLDPRPAPGRCTRLPAQVRRPKVPDCRGRVAIAPQAVLYRQISEMLLDRPCFEGLSSRRCADSARAQRRPAHRGRATATGRRPKFSAST